MHVVTISKDNVEPVPASSWDGGIGSNSQRPTRADAYRSPTIPWDESRPTPISWDKSPLQIRQRQSKHNRPIARWQRDPKNLCRQPQLDPIIARYSIITLG